MAFSSPNTSPPPPPPAPPTPPLPSLVTLCITALLPSFDSLPISDFGHLEYNWPEVCTTVRSLYDSQSSAASANGRLAPPPGMTPPVLLAVERANPSVATFFDTDALLWKLYVEHYYPHRSKALKEPYSAVRERAESLLSSLSQISSLSRSLSRASPLPAPPPPAKPRPTEPRPTVAAAAPAAPSRESSAVRLTRVLVALAALPISEKLLEDTGAGKCLAKFCRRNSSSSTSTSNTSPLPFVTSHHLSLASKALASWKTSMARSLDPSSTSTGMTSKLSYLDDRVLLSKASTWRELYHVLLLQRSEIAVHTEKMRALRDSKAAAGPKVKKISSKHVRKVAGVGRMLMGSAARSAEDSQASRDFKATSQGRRWTALKTETAKASQKRGGSFAATTTKTTTSTTAVGQAARPANSQGFGATKRKAVGKDERTMKPPNFNLEHFRSKNSRSLTTRVKKNIW